jgi:hypothetical protein
MDCWDGVAMKLVLLILFCVCEMYGQLAASVGTYWRYNSQHPTHWNKGDTYRVTWATTKLVMCNDCESDLNAIGGRLVYSTISDDLRTQSGLHNYTDFSGDDGWADGRHWYMSSAWSYNGCTYMPVYRQENSFPFSGLNMSIMKSCDGVTSWTRPQDGTSGVNGNPPTSPNAMWAGASVIAHAYGVEFCVENVTCANTPDSSDTHIVGVSTDSNFTGNYAWRVLKTDIASQDATKYEFWDGVTFSAIGSAVPMQCIINGVTVSMTAANCGILTNAVFVSDALMNGGGSYFALSTTGAMLRVWSAPHYYGPWTQIGIYQVDTIRNPPINLEGAVVPWSYVRVSATPYLGKLKIICNGKFTQQNVDPTLDQYSSCDMDLMIANAASVTRPKPWGGNSRGNLPPAAMETAWMFGDNRIEGSTDVRFFADSSPNRANSITTSGATNVIKSAIITASGAEDTRTDWRTEWLCCNLWRVPSTFGKSMGDFSVLVVYRIVTNAGGFQTILSGPISPNKGMEIIWIPPNTISASVNTSAGDLSVSYTGPTTGTWAAFLFIRRGNTIYLYRPDGNVTTNCCNAALTDSAGAYVISLGAMPNTTNPGSGTYGTVAIWSRALSTTEIPIIWSTVHLWSTFRKWTGL